MTESNRRGFLRALGLRAASNARDAAEVARPFLRATTPLGTVERLLEHAAPAPTPPADDDTAPSAHRPDGAPPTHCLTRAELDALIAAEGLESRQDAIAALALATARIVLVDTPHDADAWVDLDAAARLGAAGGPQETVLLAQVDQSSAALRDTSLAGDGWLAVFVDSSAPTEAPGGPLATSVVRLAEAAFAAPTARPATLRAHLALPRLWNAAVQALDLDADASEAYTRLRDRTAETQGIGIEHGGGERRAYHRLLGHPDETTGAMPQDCVEALGEGDWQLLAQVSLPGRQRAYTWLRAGDSSDAAVTFVR